MLIELPFVSIIIPTFNRPDHLRNCLSAISRLDYPHEKFEVIVVDDGGPQPLDAVIEPFKSSLLLRLLRQVNKGAAVARNTGVAAAHGTMIAFTDDDCEPDEGWLRGLAVRYIATPDCLIGGHTINLLSGNLYSTASQIITDIVYRHYNADQDNARFITSNNMALSADVLRDIGAFDPTFVSAAAEDRELCDRWRHLGKQIVYAPEITMYHSHDLSLLGYLRQHFNYGRGACHFHQKRIRRGVRSFRAEVSFHRNVYNWLVYPLTRVPGWQRPSLLGLILLWQSANAAGYFFELLRLQNDRQPNVPVMPDRSA